MAQFQNESVHFSARNSLSDGRNAAIMPPTTNEPALPTAGKRSRQMSIDSLNASRPRINSFPVPPLPRDETADEEFFDAECKLLCRRTAPSGDILVELADDSDAR